MKDNSTKALYEKYVTNIDVSQRLYACGFTYPTMFFWIANPKLDTLHLYQSGMEYNGPLDFKFPAATAMELKERYPDKVWVATNNNRSHIRRQGIFYFTRFNGKHIVSLMIKSDETNQIYEVHREEDINEANAAGLMYCHIYENHLDQLHS